MGYLVNVEGTILFSSVATDDYLISSEPWGSIFRKYIDNDVSVNTPAGDFEAIQNDRYAVSSNGEVYSGVDSQFVSQGVGTIKRATGLVTLENPLYIMTLKSYSVADGD